MEKRKQTFKKLIWLIAILQIIFSVYCIGNLLKEKEQILKTCDTENVEEMVHVIPMINVLREDVREQPFTRESLLKGAPQRSDDSWQVPRLVK